MPLVESQVFNWAVEVQTAQASSDYFFYNFDICYRDIWLQRMLKDILTGSMYSSSTQSQLSSLL